MAKPPAKPALIYLSVEEENLAGIPFAGLERRVGKRISQIEIKRTKTLPDGTELKASWQVQGNSELAWAIEQDLNCDTVDRLNGASSATRFCVGAPLVRTLAGSKMLVNRGYRSCLCT